MIFKIIVIITLILNGLILFRIFTAYHNSKLD